MGAGDDHTSIRVEMKPLCANWRNSKLKPRRACRPTAKTRQRSPCCWTVKRARHLRADLACAFRDAPQLRLRVFDLNAKSFLEILCTQELFHEAMVCCSLPLKVCLESRYS